jgi:hypothetical protein
MLHEVDREAYDLACPGNVLELRNEIGVLRRAAHERSTLAIEPSAILLEQSSSGIKQS